MTNTLGQHRAEGGIWTSQDGREGPDSPPLDGGHAYAVLRTEYHGPCAPWLMQFNHADNQPH